jgi:hypothetical protein
MPLIKPAGGGVALERPEAQKRKSALCNREQCSADTAALRRRQDVELIDPPFAKRNDAEHLLVIEVAPDLAGREDALFEEPSNPFGRVKPRKGGQSMVERHAMHGSGPIHVFQFKLPEHSMSRARCPLRNSTAGPRPSNAYHLAAQAPTDHFEPRPCTTTW